MSDEEPLDRIHLLMHAQTLFPGAKIDVAYDPDEIIHFDVNGHRYTLEIGSDDDEYVFSDGSSVFTIPIIDFDVDFLGFLLTRLPNPS